MAKYYLVVPGLEPGCGYYCFDQTGETLIKQRWAPIKGHATSDDFLANGEPVLIIPEKTYLEITQKITITESGCDIKKFETEDGPMIVLRFKPYPEKYFWFIKFRLFIVCGPMISFKILKSKISDDIFSISMPDLFGDSIFCSEKGRDALLPLGGLLFVNR